MGDTEPPLVEGNRDELATALDGAAGLFVGLDFDGTLAPISDDPTAPEMTDGCRAALAEFVATASTTVAVVSGRELSDLRPRVGVSGVLYAGNHGLELDRGGTRVVHPVADDRQSTVRDAVATLEDRLGDVPGCEVEDKQLTATVHYRRTPRDRVEEIRATVESVASEADDDLRLTRGKEVLELRPSVDWDKGTAVRSLVDRVEGSWRPIYVGDDVTDEDGFRAVQPEGVGVLVGGPRDTHAAYRLDRQSDVAPFLSWLAGVA